MFLFSLMCLVAALVVVSAVVFEDCGSAYELEEVSIEGCGMRLPCYVTLGENIPVNVKFYAEPCETVDCPVRTDAATSFTSVMSVPINIAMNQRGYLRWRVYNENGRLVLCYAVLVQTQSPLQKLLRQASGDDTRLHPPRANSTDVQYLDDIVTR